MATGWAREGAVQDQIDATVKDAIKRAKSQLPSGPSLESCAECGANYQLPLPTDGAGEQQHGDVAAQQRGQQHEESVD